MFYKKIYITFILISNNIFYNFYLFSNIFFPKYFKDRMIKIKELNDTYYNNLVFLLYSEEIYEKYDIDLLKFKELYNDMMNKKIENNKDDNENDNSIQTSSNSSLCSSSCSSLNSSFYDELLEEE